MPGSPPKSENRKDGAVSSMFWRVLVRRLAQMVPTFFGVTLLCFALLRLANADPVGEGMSEGVDARQVSHEALATLRGLYQLDQPWYVQYATLLRRLVTCDFGTRWQDGRPIVEVIGEALPVTVTLSALALLVSYGFSICLGVFSVKYRGTLGDALVSLVLFLVYSLPSFWVGTMLLVFLASGRFVDCSMGEGAGCFPLQGWHSFEGFSTMTFWERCRDVAWHVTLPVVTLSYGSLASLSRYVRSSMLECLRLDFIRTARAKGASPSRILFRHALKNALVPVVTLLGATLPFLISGSVIVEQIFGIRGMGYLALEAIRLPDYPLVITIVALMAVVTMVGTLLSDLGLMLLDPRIAFGEDGR